MSNSSKQMMQCKETSAAKDPMMSVDGYGRANFLKEGASEARKELFPSSEPAYD